MTSPKDEHVECVHCGEAVKPSQKFVQTGKGDVHLDCINSIGESNHRP